MPRAALAIRLGTRVSPEGISTVLDKFKELPMLVAAVRRVLLYVGMLSD